MRLAARSTGVVLSLSLVGCVNFCDTDNDSALLLSRIAIPPTATVEGSLAEFDVAPGETVLRQHYSIEEGGTFVLHRTVETEVASLHAAISSIDENAAEVEGHEPFSAVLVRGVERDGAAAAAGLHAGDVIRSFDGKPVSHRDQLLHLLEEKSPGDVVTVGYGRYRDEFEVDVTLGAESRLESAKRTRVELPFVNDQDRAGLSLAELTPRLVPLVSAAPAVANEARGALIVTNVLPGGPAFFGDVRVRDLLVRVADVPVASVDDYLRALADSTVGDDVPCVVIRDGVEHETTIELADEATADGGFNLISLVKYRRRPEHREFSLVWELLFNAERCHAVESEHNRPVHKSSTRWGALLNLVHYASHRGGVEIRLLWFLPISFRRS